MPSVQRTRNFTACVPMGDSRVVVVPAAGERILVT